MFRQTVLLADDEETLRRNLAKVLSWEGFTVVACRNGTEALEALKKQTIDVMITDLRMPGLTGMELIDHASELVPDAIVIVMTAFGEVETAVSAMKKGAKDYICKPLNFDELIFRLKRLIASDSIDKENRVLREQMRKSHGGELVSSPESSFGAIVHGIDKVARTQSNVLICGESGTGKEVLARAIHYCGPLAERPFVAVNCGGLSESLVESELFGHRKNAVPGAESERVGSFEAARGGTLFLDEIGNLPMTFQPKLLRALEDRTVTRVGDQRARPVDVRLIAATNHNLEELIAERTFREDLFYRLNAVRIDIPPLRERREDIPLLIEHFLDKYNTELQRTCPGFSRDAIDLLTAQPWNGNVRELENFIERALIFHGDAKIWASDLAGIGSASITTPIQEPPVSRSRRDLRMATREFERHHITDVLEAVGDNKTTASELLGISLSSLYRKMDELGIVRERNGNGEESAG